MIEGRTSRSLFVVSIGLVLTGVLSPPLALLAGISFAMACRHPYEQACRTWTGWLLQSSVVALGFGMNLAEVLRAGRSGFAYTAIGIVFAIVLGVGLGRVLKVKPKAGLLIAAGTAICGGSAIAALAPILNPEDDELAMALGTVFTLNSAALLIFPAIGAAMHLTQPQFGLWAALAIHDTSSVVGATAKFGAEALAIGTVVKLTRAMWIVPVALVTAVATRSKARITIPWFIVLFCAASALKTGLPGGAPLFDALRKVGHIGLAMTLFLIGTGLGFRTLRQSGGRVLAQGALLWLVVACASLFAVHQGWIAI